MYLQVCFFSNKHRDLRGVNTIADNLSRVLYYIFGEEIARNEKVKLQASMNRSIEKYDTIFRAFSKFLVSFFLPSPYLEEGKFERNE